jgi:hypothetical protein
VQHEEFMCITSSCWLIGQCVDDDDIVLLLLMLLLCWPAGHTAGLIFCLSWPLLLTQR